MPNIASSSFPGSNGTELSASDANWSKANGFTANALLDGTGGVQDQFGNPNCYQRAESPPTADYDVQVTLTQTVNASVYTSGPATRIGSDGKQYAMLWLGGSQDWRLVYADATGTIVLASGSTTNPPNTASRVVKIRCVGNAITAFVDGVQIYSVTDNSLFMAGKPGINLSNTNLLRSFTADTIGSGPAISVNPTNQYGSMGSTATFSITAVGTGTVTYQWQSSQNGVDWTDIGGATSSSYTTPTIASGSPSSSLMQTATSNVYGTNSAIGATLTNVKKGSTLVMRSNWFRTAANTPPSAPPGWLTAMNPTGSSHPSGFLATTIFYLENAVGGTYSPLIVHPAVVYGTAELSEWQGLELSSSIDATAISANGAAITTLATGSTAVPSTTKSLVLTSIVAGGAGSSAYGFSVTSPYVITTIYPNELVAASGAYAYKEVSGTAASQSATWSWTPSASAMVAIMAFKVRTSYVAPFTYYRCNAADSTGTASSAAGLLTVLPPIIGSAPTSQYTTFPATQTFSVSTANTSTSYQWRKQGVNISGETSSSFTLQLSWADRATYYDCVITNANGSTTTVPAYAFVVDRLATKGRTLGSAWAFRRRGSNMSGMSLLRKQVTDGDKDYHEISSMAEWFGFGRYAITAWPYAQVSATQVNTGLNAISYKGYKLVLVNGKLTTFKEPDGYLI